MNAVMKRRGYALISVLIVVVAVGLASTVAVSVAQTDAQRDREVQLLFVGHQIRDALSSYYAATEGGAGQFPQTLDELLIDERWPTPRHHLRRLWPDPMTGSTEWGLIRSADRIVGVHSRSGVKPLKRANFDDGDEFTKAASYAEWVFTAREFESGAAGAAPAPVKSPFSLFDGGAK